MTATLEDKATLDNPAKRGDLIVVERTSCYSCANGDSHWVVTSITRDGKAKRYRDAGYGTEHELGRVVGLKRWYIYPKGEVF